MSGAWQHGPFPSASKKSICVPSTTGRGQDASGTRGQTESRRTSLHAREKHREVLDQPDTNTYLTSPYFLGPGKSDQRVKAWFREKKDRAGRLLTSQVSEHRFQTQTSRREGHCTKVMGRPENGVSSPGTDPEATVRKSPKSGTVIVGCC